MSTHTGIGLRDALREFVEHSDLDDPYEITLAFIDECGDGWSAVELLEEFGPAIVSREQCRIRTLAATRARSGRNLASHRSLIEAWRVGVIGKRLLDCTAADLELASQIHEERATVEQGRSDDYTNLAALLKRHGADTLAQVPIDEVSAILGRRNG